MGKERTLTVSLEEFGLSKYEAQAYVTLISKGTISAAELAYYAELPRTKVYPTLLKLEKKRLAIISKSKPIMCTSIAPEDAFDEIIHEQIDKVNAMNSLVTNLKKVSEETKKSRGAEERRYFNLSANNVLDSLKTNIESSKKSICAMVDQWGLGLLSECKEPLSAAVRKGVEQKIIIHTSLVGSEDYKTLPNGLKIRASDFVNNCIIFDGTEVMIIDNDNGKGSIFSSTDVLGSNQNKIFNEIWKYSTKVECLADMTKSEANEIYKILKLVSEMGLNHILYSSSGAKKGDSSLLKLLEDNGINLKSKNIDEVIEIIDSSVQISCSGYVSYDEKLKNITIESKLNSGHSLPWANLLESYLQKNGHKTRTIYQNTPQKGEKVLIKFNS